MRYSILIVLVIAAFEVGCGAKLPSLKPFKMEIQQGNVVTSKMLLQLRPGMTRSQVRYIMGTPLIVDSFRDNRWDYFYDLRKQGVTVEKRRVILDFDKDTLVSVRGDVVPSTTTVDKAPEVKVADGNESSWVDKLKFWQGENRPAELAVKPQTPTAPAAKGESAQMAAQTVPESTAITPSVEKVAPSPMLDGMEMAAGAPTLDAPLPAPATEDTQAAVQLDASAAIQSAVDAWADAWRKKNLAAYFAAYAAEFVPEGNLSKKDWESLRKQRIQAVKGGIQLEIGALNIQRQDAWMQVTFQQKYASKDYRDALTKTLIMQFDATKNAWLITREYVAGSATLAPVVALPQSDAFVEAAVQSWAQAWRSKNLNAYFSAYADDFMPENGVSKVAWMAQRKQRLSVKQGSITLDLSDIRIQRNYHDATVVFTQKYASNVYKDEVRKQLRMKFSPNKQAWLIVREQPVQDAGSPAVKQEIMAPEGSEEHLDGLLEQIGF